MNDGDSVITVKLDEDVINFTPNDLNDFPIHASDFMQIPEGIPTLIYTNGSDKYIVALTWNGEVKEFDLIVASPSSKSINSSYQVIYEPEPEEVEE